MADVEGGGFFAEDMFAGGESLDTELGVGVGMGGDVDGIDVGGKQGFESGGDCEERRICRRRRGRDRGCGPRRRSGWRFDGLKAVGEAGAARPGPMMPKRISDGKGTTG